jgi:hypothetical protein
MIKPEGINLVTQSFEELCCLQLCSQRTVSKGRFMFVGKVVPAPVSVIRSDFKETVILKDHKYSQA